MSFFLKFLLLPVLAFAGGGWFAHRWDEGAVAKLERARDDETAAATRTALALRKSQDAATLAAALETAAAQERIRVVTHTLIEKVPVHVSLKADSDCIVPDGFVRVFDSAASGGDPADLPGSSAEPDDAPSGISLSQVAALSAENDGRYRAVAEELKELQAWVRAQEAAASAAR